MTERLTDKERQLLHNLNMAARKEARSSDLNEWYYYYSKMNQTFSDRQIKRYYGLQYYSQTRRKPQQ